MELTHRVSVPSVQQEELYSLSNWPDSRDRARERAPLPLSLCTLRFVTVVTEIKIPSVEYQKLSKVPSVNSGVVIIIIYPLTARIAGTLQMISQPVFFFLCPFFTVPHCPMGPAELQSCPFPNVVFRGNQGTLV